LLNYIIINNRKTSNLIIGFSSQ